MRIDIKSILYCTGASLAVETEISPKELAFSFQDYRLTRPLTFQGTLLNTGDGILTLNGRLETGLEGGCARCLVPVQIELDIPVVDSYQPAAHDAADVDEDSYQYKGSVLDISQAIRDNLLLAMPQRLLCREGCLGLCPDCGLSLNDKDCGCAAAGNGRPSPFDQLKKLL
jgi:uncharacterized protein